MYNEFSTANIQVDKDFSAKLSGYGCVGHIPEEEIPSSSSVSSDSIIKSVQYILATQFIVNRDEKFSIVYYRPTEIESKWKSDENIQHIGGR